jgi:amyloid beta precursor protein binding protein 1
MVLKSCASVRDPTADMPNDVALAGELVAQEMIKLITKQYVAIIGYYAVNLLKMFTPFFNA